MSAGDLLGRLSRLLDGAEIPYMVVGSLASSFHAEPRTTRDIDLVIDPTAETLRRFVDSLPADEFYADADAAAEAFDRRTSFNLVDRATGWKVDFMVCKDRPFSREELRRRLAVRLLGIDTHVASAEDTIVAKLEWAQQGGSDRQIGDVAAILAVSGATLDRAYLERWIADLGLIEPWRHAQDVARSSGSG